jgi:hypothetical protein
MTPSSNVSAAIRTRSTFELVRSELFHGQTPLRRCPRVQCFDEPFTSTPLGDLPLRAFPPFLIRGNISISSLSLLPTVSLCLSLAVYPSLRFRHYFGKTIRR